MNVHKRRLHLLLFVLVLAVIIANGIAQAPEKSTITVRVGKAGMFSGFGHTHTITAPVARVAVDSKSKTAAITVLAKEMKVVDTELSEKDRTEIQTTMLGPKVLDAQRFPEIRFTSTRIEETAPGRFRVAGKLELHGVSKELDFPVSGTPEHYSGKAKFKQTDFGIQPVSVAGGAVKVKDEVEIDFDIYPGAAAQAGQR